MALTITGDASQITTPISKTVNGATNASPIVISTTTAHLFATGDRVTIAGAGGNTAANGAWTITKTTSTAFSLNGSTGNGAWTSGGTATNHSLTPQFQIPDDGEDIDAASVNVALEALADRSQFLKALIDAGVIQVKTWTSDTTWQAPTNVASIGLLIGYGGGGAGGVGSGGVSTTSFEASGGAGGGGCIQSIQVVVLVGGTTYTIDIGAGGATAGADGADTTFTDGVTTKTFRGAGGGASGATALDGSAGAIAVAEGGQSVRGTAAVTASVFTTLGAMSARSSVMACGGWTSNQGGNAASGVGHAGGHNPTGYAGGAAGANGTQASATKIGGTGGSGGGAGPGGAGGAGGAGGNAAAAAPGSNGSAGTAAGANTGAGGGGGGGGGAGNSTTTGGAFGAGGSGKLILVYFGDAT